MKVGVLLRNVKSPERGGSFTFQDSIVQGISSQSDLTHEFVVFHKGDPIKEENSSKISYVSLDPYENRSSWHKHIPGPIRRIGQSLGEAGRYILGSSSSTSPPLERAARDHNISFFWFPTPSFVETGLPYITTVWDLGHRLIPMFPEVRRTGYTWDKREEHYRTVLRKAAYVITGTETGKRQIQRYYQVDQDRIKVNPFPTPPFALEADDVENVSVDLPERFLFYPAQFWPHKNHILILRALEILREQGFEIPVVFTGSDKGNRAYVEKVAQERNVSELVHFLGFVSRETLTYLYQNALALVYVTFLGPDNLPPLEAFAFGCPVIASDIPGSEEQLGDAALRVDPTSEADLADAIRQLHESHETRKELQQRGTQRATEWLPEHYVSRIVNVLHECMPYRRCWDPEDNYEHL